MGTRAHARRGLARLAAAGVLAAALPALARAQEATVYATASVDGHDTNIELVGGSLRPPGLGLKPVLGLSAYRLQYDTGLDNVTVWSIAPSLGAAYRMDGGSVEGRVGYSFQSDDDVEAPFIEGEGGRSGFTTAVQAQWWGSQPELQGIASYSWRSEYLWSQAQAVMPVVQLDPGNIGVGAEVVWQGNIAGDTDFSSWQVGPLVRWSTGHDSSVLVGGGYKDSSSRSATWYARIGFVKYGIEL